MRTGIESLSCHPESPATPGEVRPGLSPSISLPASDTTMPLVTVEHAKTGRASCRRCREKLDKGDLRIGTPPPTHTRACPHPASPIGQPVGAEAPVDPLDHRLPEGPGGTSAHRGRNGRPLQAPRLGRGALAAV